MPLEPIDNEANKLFLECEMQVGELIFAHVTKSGSFNGQSPQSYVDTNLVRLSLRESAKDYNIAFKYNVRNKRYEIPKSEMTISSGKTYIIEGVYNEREPKIVASLTVPNLVYLDSLVIVDYRITKISDNVAKTYAEFQLKLPKSGYSSDYLHLILKDKNDKSINSIDFINSNQSIFELKHKEGFLINTTRVEGNFVTFKIEHTSEDELSEISIIIRNTTESYYLYNKFKSNSEGATSTSINPAIAAFNINSKVGYGSFSAFAETRKNYTIK